jgi:hypothetical protein
VLIGANLWYFRGPFGGLREFPSLIDILRWFIYEKTRWSTVKRVLSRPHRSGG